MCAVGTDRCPGNEAGACACTGVSTRAVVDGAATLLALADERRRPVFGALIGSATPAGGWLAAALFADALRVRFEGIARVDARAPAEELCIFSLDRCPVPLLNPPHGVQHELAWQVSDGSAIHALVASDASPAYRGPDRTKPAVSGSHN